MSLRPASTTSSETDARTGSVCATGTPSCYLRGGVPLSFLVHCARRPARRTPMAKLKLDLHDIYNDSRQLDAELARIIDEAVRRKISLVEIIPGKGSGQLKKRVLRFLNQSHIRALYHRVEKDDKNFGRVFVHFKH